MNDYLIRAASRENIIAMLAEASEGCAEPYVWEFEGATVFRTSCVIEPWPEMVLGDTFESTDPDTGEAVVTTHMVETGDWLCRVLVDEPNTILAMVASL